MTTATHLLKTYRLEEYVGPAAWAFIHNVDTETRDDAVAMFREKYPRANIVEGNSASNFFAGYKLGDCRVTVASNR